MAEEKKGGSEGGGEGISEFGWFIIILGVLIGITFRWIPSYIASLFSGATTTATEGQEAFPTISNPAPSTSFIDLLQDPTGTTRTFEYVQTLWTVLLAVSVFVSLLLLSGILYAIFRIYQVRQSEKGKYAALRAVLSNTDVSRAQLRWNKIVEQANSNNEQDWRLAIIEADIMLNELLDVQGYRGDTMADKMKQVEKSDFNTIDSAWEAHKVRNRIAHEGADVVLNIREVRRIIHLYYDVFREFEYIE